MINKRIYHWLLVLLVFTAVCSQVTITCYAGSDSYMAYIRGLLHQRKGNARMALKEYELALLLDKDAVILYRELSFLHWQLGDKNKAFEAAEKLHNLAGDDVDTNLFLGGFYLLTEKGNEARKSWEKVLSIDPENEEALLYLASYFSTVNPKESIEYWKKYIKIKPESADACYQMGITYEGMGDLEKSKSAFEKVIDIQSDMPEAYLSLAQIYEKKNNIPDAQNYYEKYITLQPNDQPVLTHLGSLYFKTENMDSAENAFIMANKIDPDDTSIHFWLGVIAEKKRDWKKAIEHFEYILKKQETPVVLDRLSYYYSVQKNFKKAVKYLKRAIDIEPENPNHYYFLGLAYFDLKEYRTSEKNLSKAIELKPDFSSAHFYLGVLYDNWDKFGKARQHLKIAVNLDPENASALNYLGYSLIDKEIDLTEGLKYVEEALNIKPDNSAFLDSLGWYYFKTGDFKKSEEYVKKASEEMQDPIIFEHLGDVKMKLNEVSEAWDAYNIALELDPKNKSLKRKLSELRKLVLPKTWQRKVLKRAAGNLLQVKTLKAVFAVNIKSDEYNYRSFGNFYYSRPSMWRLDVFGNILYPNISLIYNSSLAVIPEALRSELGIKQFGNLGDINEYFNSKLIDGFDNNETSAKKKGESFYYKNADAEMVINYENGTLSEYKSADGIKLKFLNYEYVDGLYLPSLIEVYILKQKAYAKIKLKGFKLNETIESEIFSSKTGFVK